MIGRNTANEFVERWQSHGDESKNGWENFIESYQDELECYLGDYTPTQVYSLLSAIGKGELQLFDLFDYADFSFPINGSPKHITVFPSEDSDYIVVLSPIDLKLT